jgi:hypothetical protein
LGNAFDSGNFEGLAEPPVLCAAPDCPARVIIPDEKHKLEEWASYKGEGTFWYCPVHKNQAGQPASA